MSLRKAAEMALEALKWYVEEDDVIESMAGNEPWVEGKRNAENVIQLLRQALAMERFSEVSQEIEEALKQEPVAWMTPTGALYRTEDVSCFDDSHTPLYTAPPKREWVGLTDEDKEGIKNKATYNWDTTAGEYASEVQALTEAKLKEKNGG